MWRIFQWNHSVHIVAEIATSLKISSNLLLLYLRAPLLSIVSLTYCTNIVVIFVIKCKQCPPLPGMGVCYQAPCNPKQLKSAACLSMFFWGETLVQRLTDMVLLSLSLRFTLDLPTKWTHVKVVLPLRHGHVQRALGMGVGGTGGAVVYFFGLREMRGLGGGQLSISLAWGTWVQTENQREVTRILQ